METYYGIIFVQVRAVACSKSNASYVIKLSHKMKLPTNIMLHFVAMCQMAAEGHSYKLTSDMEVHLKQ